MRLAQWRSLLLTAASFLLLYLSQNDNGPDGTTPLDQVPFHLYRTSYDIRPTYGSIANNAQTVFGNTAAVSGPSCWAYPDMLEVGVTVQVLTARAPVRPEHAAAVARALSEPLPPVLNLVEARTHFAMWCVLSSPLTLTNNLTDSDGLDAVWPIITNTEGERRLMRELARARARARARDAPRALSRRLTPFPPSSRKPSL